LSDVLALLAALEECVVANGGRAAGAIEAGRAAWDAA
jgi:hypothetical protein